MSAFSPLFQPTLSGEQYARYVLGAYQAGNSDAMDRAQDAWSNQAAYRAQVKEILMENLHLAGSFDALATAATILDLDLKGWGLPGSDGDAPFPTDEPLACLQVNLPPSFSSLILS